MVARDVGKQMTEMLTLELYLDQCTAQHPALAPVCRTILDLATAGRRIAGILAHGPLAGALSARVGDSLDGDGQKALDVMTHDILRDALRNGAVQAFASEEADVAEVLDPAGTIVVAADPLDGSSNIDTLAPIGTIFSILPATGDAPFLQPGRNQLAAGFLIYGPQTALAITLGAGTRIFTLHPGEGTFIDTRGDVTVPSQTKEYAINASNQRHWDQEIGDYVGELLQGTGGPRGTDYNTRWLASMVADAYRILIRGGVYLYPGDRRRGYGQGRLRLIYEANPIAMLMEQAGGAATDGKTPILDLLPTELHQRCPLVFGAAEEVRRVAAAYAAPRGQGSPLFNRRSLFRNSDVIAEMRA
jgi:fructose-1,6-bisphosphatase I